MRLYLFALIFLTMNTPTSSNKLIDEQKPSSNLEFNPIEIIRPWARPAIRGRNTAVYMGVANLSDTDDQLIDAHSASCQRIELHDHHEEAGVMRMHRVGIITVPHKGNITLIPGAKHIMCIGLNHNLNEGDVIQVDLQFENAGKVTASIPVRNQY